MNQPEVKRHLGYSLVEVLIVIGLIGMLIGLLLPAIQNVREAASRASCQNNLKQIGLAAQNYHSAHGRLPRELQNLRAANGRLMSVQWTHLVLPYLDQENVYRESLDAFQQNNNPYKNPPHRHVTTVVKVFTCRSDWRMPGPTTDTEGNTCAYASYFGNSGTAPPPSGGASNGAFGVSLVEFRDGSSQTLFVGERPPPAYRFAGSWYAFGYLPQWGYDFSRHLYGLVDYPSNSDPCRKPMHFAPGRVENPCDSHHFWSFHPGGANFVFADGSVRFLTYSADPMIHSLATRNGGEVASAP